jgi:ribosome-associated toxin RatA of RatAB toxin-antitoxin module
MIRHSKFPVVALVGILGSVVLADDTAVLTVKERERLTAGETVVLSQRPDETEKMDHRFVTVAAVLEGPSSLLWEVINDKENAATFLDGVLESKVIKRDGNTLIVEQVTHVGGPRGSYRYRLRHQLTPKTRADFTYIEGELRNIEGSWWIFGESDSTKCLLVYSLHIDPGLIAPQPVVKSGMRRTMPKTIECIRSEVTRRRSAR